MYTWDHPGRTAGRPGRGMVRDALGGPSDACSKPAAPVALAGVR
jgi:hypothetical protein